MCPICSKDTPHGYTTCGGSYCQEAAYYNNAARCTRSGSKKAQLFEKARRAEDKATRSRY